MGCDLHVKRGLDFRRAISIHAPQWGATHLWYSGNGRNDFNPRTPVGCDHRIVSPQCLGCYFNPRTPVGCDVAEQGHVGAVQRISIHAPQWGATLWLSVAIICSGNFNPRTPVGCDHREGRRPPSPAHFNPRTPVGCDPCPRHRRHNQSHFNPRTPVGCDSHRIGRNQR